MTFTHHLVSVNSFAILIFYSNKASIAIFFFLVLGNICRSPIAEAVFAKLIKDRNLQDRWSVDSAALGSWHVGNSPDYRALSTLKKHNVPYDNTARQVKIKFHFFLAHNKPLSMINIFTILCS